MWAPSLLLLPLIVVVLIVVVLVAVVALLIARTDVLVVVAVLLSPIALVVVPSSGGKHRFLIVSLQLVHGVSTRASFMRIAAGVTETAIAMAHPSMTELVVDQASCLAVWMK